MPPIQNWHDVTTTTSPMEACAEFLQAEAMVGTLEVG